MLHAYCEIDFPHPSQAGRLKAAFSSPLCILSAATASDAPGVVEQAEAWSRAGHWVVGFVAYESARAFDGALCTHDAPDALPYALFAVFREPDDAPRARGDFLYGAWRDDTARERFDVAVERIREGIARGDFYQVNYATRLRAPFLGDALAFYDGLRAAQPDAYCAYLDFGRWQVCSVSPELFFNWPSAQASQGARTLTCKPMKGTAPRHADPVQDRAAAESLRQSPKERAENLMIVDLVRNDLSRVAVAGSVRASNLFEVEAWPTVWQMISTISCRTSADTRLRDVFRAAFPCGSVTGAPKAASMSAIRALEYSPRGVYCGAVGMLMPDGTASFAVGIRTPVIDTATHVAECGIGSGITIDSAPAQEYAEWRAKQGFLMRACPEYELLETLRLHRGRYWLLRGHLRRLEHSARVLGYPFREEALMQALRETALQHPSGDWRVRLRLSGSGEARVDALPLDAVPPGARFARSAAPVASANPWLRHKTTRRDLYAAHAVAAPGIFDTLLYNERGELTEFTRGNLVAEIEGHLLTPHADSGLLPGVYRAALLSRRRIREAVLHADDLKAASRVWFINSVRGAIEVFPAPEGRRTNPGHA
jgi:para-aminobenzoate synthetase / 4-amino-4-deoxychorismate lyase